MNKGFRIEKRRIGKAVVYMVLILLALYTLFPLLILVINSFKPHTDIIANPLAWPRPVDIGFVIKALRELKFTQSFFVTLFITTISILLIVMASSLAAWAMIRNKTVYSKLVFYIFIAAMLVPFQAVMFPLLNVFEKIGMKNIWGLVIMYGGFGMSMSIFLYHGFMKSVPVSLEEAAVLDGAGAIQIFLKVVFPLVKGTTSTVIILNALWIWNDYLLPYLVLGTEKKTVPVAIQIAMQGAYGSTDYGGLMAMLVLAMIPIVVFYLFCQKYIIKGVVAGAVKG